MDGESPQIAQSDSNNRKFRVPNIPKISLQGIMGFFKRYWGILLVLLIVLLAVHVRLLDYRWPYLRNIDSYNFMRDMELIIQNGGVMPQTDPLMLVPEGSAKYPGTFYPYFGAYSFMLYKFLVPGAELWRFLVWFPALIAALSAIPAYFLGKKLYDKKAGIFAALLVVFDISIMARTLGGDPDNDGIVILLPLLIITAFVYVHDYVSKKNKLDAKGIIYSTLVGFALALWAWTWGGYWFVIGIIFGFIFLRMIIEMIVIKDIRKGILNYRFEIASAVIMFLSMTVVMTVIVQPTFVSALLYQLLGIANFGDIKSETGTFPNVYVSVAELQSAGGLEDIVRRIGPPFFTTLLVVFYLAYSYIKKRKHIDPLVLLFIWFVGPMIATLVAVRFTILFATPMAIGTAILFSKIIRMITGEDKTLEE